MRYQAIAPLFNIIFSDGQVSAQLEEYIVSTEKRYSSEFFSDTHTIECVGKIYLDSINRMPFAYLSTNHNIPNAGIEQTAHMYMMYLGTLLLHTWLVKDNAITHSTYYCKDNFIGAVTCRTTDSIFSNSTGAYDPVTFDPVEWQDILKYHNAILVINMLDGPNANSPGWDANSNVSQGTSEMLPYTHNRFNRAFKFLHGARTSSHLPHKISFYIGMLECLFTTDNDCVKKKVCYRASYYVGDKIEESIKLVDNAYHIRSQYMHGLSLKEGKTAKIDYLAEISFNLDDLLRKIVRKVVLSDSELFTSNDADKFKAYIENVVPFEFVRIEQGCKVVPKNS